jgi:sulfotransferase
MKEIFYVSGLPRSGSTLLMNLLAQHPLVHATPTSGCCSLLNGVKLGWNSIIEHKADKNASSPQNLKNVLNSVLYNYHNTEKSVIIDKSRSWGANIEMVEYITGKKMKIIAPVRDISEILASFEVLHRNGSSIKSTMQNYQTTQSRVDHWASNIGEVGSAYNVLRDVFQRGLQDRLCIVEYDTLTNNPEFTMKQIWNFLGIGCVEHDFNNIQNVTPEDDDVYGYMNLHKIRQSIEPSIKKADGIIGKELQSKYENNEFWRIG